MPTVLITGANRGIGLEFARQYCADGWDVIATARHSSQELEALRVRVEPLDLSDAD
ncbi:MAG TPA: SDR family NAD(P)-dependent oxidoreductase, partial [Sphingomicrobium sp.]